MIALAGIGGLVAAAAVYGARFGPRHPKTRAWYASLDKAPFNPPNAVFAPAWTILYTLMTASAWRVWRQPSSRRRAVALGLWGAQLAANAAWTKLFFGSKRPRWALADIGAMLALIAAYSAAARKVDRPAAAMMAPYAAWVAFAALLNEEIVRRNS